MNDHLFDWLWLCLPLGLVTVDGLSLVTSPWSQILIGWCRCHWCWVICVQRESVRANVCPHSIISRQMTSTRPSYVSTSPQARRAKRFAEIYNVQFKQFTLAMAWSYLPAGGQFSANQMPGMRPGDQWEIRSDCMGGGKGWALVQRCTVRIFKIDDQSRFREH